VDTMELDALILLATSSNQPTVQVPTRAMLDLIERNTTLEIDCRRLRELAAELVYELAELKGMRK
jgi:hypothetical protein